MTDIFEEAQNVWCTQHMKERDAQKLKTMGCNERTQRRIMSDIYGCQEQIPRWGQPTPKMVHERVAEHTG